MSEMKYNLCTPKTNYEYETIKTKQMELDETV